MKFSEYDVVTIMDDRSEVDLKAGDIGTIIMVYTDPNEAYEVEFVDEDGVTRAQIVLMPNEIEKYNPQK